MTQNGSFRQSATIQNGRIRVGQTAVRTCDGLVFVVEAIWQENDRRTGSLTFLCGPDGTPPIPAHHCEKVLIAN